MRFNHSLYLSNCRILFNNPQKPRISNVPAIHQSQRLQLPLGLRGDSQKRFVGELRAQRGLDGNVAPQERVVGDGVPEEPTHPLERQELPQGEVAEHQE